MAVVALADRLFLLPDEARVALSLVGYAAAAAAFWRTCGRGLARMPDERGLAKLVELAAPKLHEALLSAVELAEDGGRPLRDSEEFRAALQDLVARQVDGLQVESLLPRKLVGQWFRALVAVAAVLLVLSAIPGLHFAQFLARAVLPGANIARPSHIRIEVLAPTPPDQAVPRGDSVTVSAATSGGHPGEVMLETFPRGGPRTRVAMKLSGPDEYSAAIEVGSDAVAYRIRAGDAITRKYLLDPKERPRVVKFRKTYLYPAYTRLPSSQVSEESGDLSALEGTTVDVRLDVDQAIRAASLEIDTGVTNIVPLAVDRGGQVTGRIALSRAGTYRVRLIAAETGFDNKFSPAYELDVQPDLRPSVAIDRPEEDELVLPPDALVQLNGTARDDLAVSNVAQFVEVNGIARPLAPLSTGGTGEVKVARSWDLASLGVRPGDRVLTRLVAEDLKGQRSESDSLVIAISAAGFDPERLDAVRKQEALQQAVHGLRDRMEQLDRRMNEARDTVRNGSAPPEAKRQALLAAATAAEAAADVAEPVLDQIKAAIPRMPLPREAYDASLLGRAVSSVAQEALPDLRQRLADLASTVSTAGQQAASTAIDKASEPFWRGMNIARKADDTQSDLLGTQQAGALSRDLEQMASEQKDVGEVLRSGSMDAERAERVTRREAVIAQEARAVEALMGDLAEHARDWPRHEAENHAKGLAQRREEIEKALASPTAAEALKQPAQAMQGAVDNAAQTMRRAERHLAEEASKNRRELENMLGPSTEAIARAARRLEQPDAADGSTAADAIDTAARHLEDRAALEELRPMPDASFVADTANAAEALRAMRDSAGAAESRTNALAAVRALELAYRKIEGGHEATEAAPALRNMAGREQWDATNPDDFNEIGRDWGWVGRQVEELPRALEQAGLPNEAVRSAREIEGGQDRRQVNDEMRRRQSEGRQDRNVAEPLNALADKVRELSAQIQPELKAARAAIEDLTPSLGERLAGLAEEAAELRDDTAALAQNDAAAAQPGELRNRAAEQQGFEQQVEDVREALRREANLEDLASAEGRESARDADDAAAMLRQTPPTAGELLQKAAASPASESRGEALQAAADRQAKLAEALEQVAAHYENADDRQVAETRRALRAAERELGLKPTLDEAYGEAQALGELAGKTPAEQLAELERALQGSAPMREELGEIAADTLASAAGQLESSASREKNIASDLDRLARAGTPQERAARIADAARKLARENIPAIAQQAGEAGAESRGRLDEAARRLESAAQKSPSDFSQPSSTAVPALREEVGMLRDAGRELDQGANQLGQAASRQSNEAAAPLREARQKAEGARQQANELAQQAEQLAHDVSQSSTPMQSAAGQQPPIEITVRSAGSDVSRAGRHQARLGAAEQGGRLQQIGNQLETQTAGQIDQAEGSMTRAESPAAAQPAAQGAHEAIRQPLEQLQSALAQSPQPSDAGGQASAMSDPSAGLAEDSDRWMARALDQLDASMHPAGTAQAAAPASKGEASSSAEQAGASQAVEAAAESQAGSMMAARASGLAPGEKPLSYATANGGGAAFAAPGIVYRQLPGSAPMIANDWGRLPTRLTSDLLEGRRQGVSGEYRDMVDVYFRAIAEKSQRKGTAN
jgi:hypothetical protein